MIKRVLKLVSSHAHQYHAARGLGLPPWARFGGDAEVILEGKVFFDTVSQSADAGRFSFAISVKTGLTRVWVLMPRGHDYDYFELSGYPAGKPELAEIVIPDTKVELPFGSIATFQLIQS